MFKLNPNIFIIGIGQFKINLFPTLAKFNFPIEISQIAARLLCVQKVEQLGFQPSLGLNTVLAETLQDIFSRLQDFLETVYNFQHLRVVIHHLLGDHGCVKKIDQADLELEGALNRYIIEFEDWLIDYV